MTFLDDSGHPQCRSSTELARKVREVVADLVAAGFVNQGGKCSHRNFAHPKGVRVTLSGGLGDDANTYQERDVGRALAAVSER